MAETVISVLGIEEMKNEDHQKTAELFVEDMSPEEKEAIVKAETRGELKTLREKVSALNEGKIHLKDYLAELKTAREALKSGDAGASPATPPASPSPDAAPAAPENSPEPQGMGDKILPMLLSQNGQLKDQFKQLASLPFIGSFLLGIFFSKKALADFGIKVEDVKLEGLLQGLDQGGQERFRQKAKEVITKHFGITETKTDLLFLLANEDEAKGPKVSVGDFLKRCPEKLDHDMWMKICKELKERKATETTAGSVMTFMIQYLKDHQGEW